MPVTTGSEPALFLYTGLAQLVEHWSPKPGVGSSSLSTRAKKDKYETETNDEYTGGLGRGSLQDLLAKQEATDKVGNHRDDSFRDYRYDNLHHGPDC